MLDSVDRADDRLHLVIIDLVLHLLNPQSRRLGELGCDPEPSPEALHDGFVDRVLQQLPAGFWAVSYVGSRFPGSRAVNARPGLAMGANCQLFAYEVLRYFDLAPPALRSSELWTDTQTTVRVSVAQPLDLLLFNATNDAYGAHVGVCVDNGRVLHLCAEAGRPAVWEMTEFATRERYRVLIGIKRVIAEQSREATSGAVQARLLGATSRTMTQLPRPLGRS